ncbi:hypothetical protein Kisp02_15350 [Kineosporia sp. NBRC 101731]|nr:hypothetical protein Kisp02_15350 [Kineosporia sp. NBRC 101731]
MPGRVNPAGSRVQPGGSADNDDAPGAPGAVRFSVKTVAALVHREVDEIRRYALRAWCRRFMVAGPLRFSAPRGGGPTRAEALSPACALIVPISATAPSD